MRLEVHGLSGRKSWCAKPTSPYIPYVDSGCPVDQTPCIVSYTSPTFGACACSSFANGASEQYNLTTPQGLCQKGGTTQLAYNSGHSAPSESSAAEAGGEATAQDLGAFVLSLSWGGSETLEQHLASDSTRTSNARKEHR